MTEDLLGAGGGPGIEGTESGGWVVCGMRGGTEIGIWVVKWQIKRLRMNRLRTLNWRQADPDESE